MTMTNAQIADMVRKLLNIATLDERRAIDGFLLTGQVAKAKELLGLLRWKYSDQLAHADVDAAEELKDRS